jgi:hypothetical protein
VHVLGGDGGIGAECFDFGDFAAAEVKVFGGAGGGDGIGPAALYRVKKLPGLAVERLLDGAIGLFGEDAAAVAIVGVAGLAGSAGKTVAEVKDKGLGAALADVALGVVADCGVATGLA